MERCKVQGLIRHGLLRLGVALCLGLLPATRADEPATYFSNSLQRAIFYGLDGSEIGSLPGSVLLLASTVP